MSRVPPFQHTVVVLSNFIDKIKASEGAILDDSRKRVGGVEGVLPCGGDKGVWVADRFRHPYHEIIYCSLNCQQSLHILFVMKALFVLLIGANCIFIRPKQQENLYMKLRHSPCRELRETS